MNKIKDNLKINLYNECSYETEKEIMPNENQINDTNDVETISNSKTYIYSNKANKSLKQMLLNGDIASDFDFKKLPSKYQRRIYNNNHGSSVSKNFPIMKRLTKNYLKTGFFKEYSKEPGEIILNERNVQGLSNSKTNNISKTNKSQKQMLLNGDIISDFYFKKPERKIRKCNQICKKFNFNQNILDYVRRSERLTETLVNDKKEQIIITHILNNREDGIITIETAEKGRGVESTVCFEKDSFVVEYAGNLISEKEAREKESIYKTDPNKGSYMFYFRFKDKKYCVDATEESGKLGRLLNHSKLNPNCYVKAIPVNGLPRLTIFAKRDIEIGEELLYDYGDRDKVSLEANPWLKF